MQPIQTFEFCSGLSGAAAIGLAPESRSPRAGVTPAAWFPGAVALATEFSLVRYIRRSADRISAFVWPNADGGTLLLEIFLILEECFGVIVCFVCCVYCVYSVYSRERIF